MNIYLDMDDSDADDFEVIPGRNVAVLTCPRVHLEDDPMSSSAKRACKIPPLVSRSSTQPDVEMGTVPLPVPEDAMEVDLDAGVEPALVRRGAKRVSAMWSNVLIKPTWKYVQTLLVSAATVTQLKHLAGVRQLESGQSTNARGSGGVSSTKSHPCRQSSARQRPTMPREMKLS